MLKKYIFNHSKDISKAFDRAVHVLLIAYLIIIALNLSAFLFDLAFKGDYYYTVRMSNLLADNAAIHIFTINLILALLAQTTTFLLVFLITEFILTYKHIVVTMTPMSFIKKNYAVVALVFVPCLVNMILMSKIESKFTEKYLEMRYTKNFGVFDKTLEGTLITLLAMYLYALLTIHDV
ncbi:hypothetical protein GINT2_002030 [Glugoides intestinalis]